MHCPHLHRLTGTLIYKVDCYNSESLLHSLYLNMLLLSLKNQSEFAYRENK